MKTTEYNRYMYYVNRKTSKTHKGNIKETSKKHFFKTSLTSKLFD